MAARPVDSDADYGPMEVQAVRGDVRGPDRCLRVSRLTLSANCLALLQKKDMRELTRSCGRTAEEVQAAVEFIRTLDPRPGQRYNQSETRLIEPDVAFVKRDDEYVVLMNEEDMPTLRLNHGISQDAAAEADGKRSQRICEGAVQVGDPAAAEHRAEEEYDCADL